MEKHTVTIRKQWLIALAVILALGLAFWKIGLTCILPSSQPESEASSPKAEFEAGVWKGMVQVKDLGPNRYHAWGPATCFEHGGMVTIRVDAGKAGILDFTFDPSSVEVVDRDYVREFKREHPDYQGSSLPPVDDPLPYLRKLDGSQQVLVDYLKTDGSIEVKRILITGVKKR